MSYAGSRNEPDYFFSPETLAQPGFPPALQQGFQKLFGNNAKRPIFAAALDGKNSSLNDWQCATSVNKFGEKNLLETEVIVSLPSATKSGSSSKKFLQPGQKKSS